MLILLSRNLMCVWKQLEGWRGGDYGASSPHQNNNPAIRSIQSHSSFQATAEATFILAGAVGCVVSSPQACSSGDSHTKSMSWVWPGYQGNQQALSKVPQTPWFSFSTSHSMNLTKTKVTKCCCRAETTAQHNRSPDPTLHADV